MIAMSHETDAPDERERQLERDMLGFAAELAHRHSSHGDETVGEIVARAADAGDPIALVLNGKPPAGLAGLALKEFLVEACRDALSPARQKLPADPRQFRLACAYGRALGEIEVAHLEIIRQQAFALKNAFEVSLVENAQDVVVQKHPEYRKLWLEQRAAAARLRTFDATTQH
jgi:hypothetical protein